MIGSKLGVVTIVALFIAFENPQLTMVVTVDAIVRSSVIITLLVIGINVPVAWLLLLAMLLDPSHTHKHERQSNKPIKNELNSEP